eukprot:TRINITY_DN77124_c0_g1_i1.p1 TRINITY_DN77124_c0_g1~~TRINITY_DN77124_c0_g1_i1.p1  ORF type:complete len:216 (-),score=26.51 TRINITY_DN77124_c0_g1_i1:37-612(-)
MSHGTFEPYLPKEYTAYALQLVLLQLAFEELWTRAAEHMLQNRPGGGRIILLTDRDALNLKAFTRPIDPDFADSWEDVLTHLGHRVDRPVSQHDLAEQHQMGVVLMQSLAVMNGTLNTEQYNHVCVGEGGTNPMRKQTAVEAQQNDERMLLAYEEAYPSSKTCIIKNVFDSFDEKLEAVLSCVRTINPDLF